MSEQSTAAVLMEIVAKVRELNLNEKKDYPIPLSDTMYRKYMGPIVGSEDQLKDLLHLLVESHYLFPLKIVEADDALMIAGVDGYVVTDIAALKTLKEVAEDELEVAYEQQMYRRKQAATIMRELLPQARNYNNTPLGRSLNVAVMLHQFEQVLISGFAEYTDGWKQSKLRELVPDIDVAALGGDTNQHPTNTDPLAFEDGAKGASADSSLDSAPGESGDAAAEFSTDLQSPPAAPGEPSSMEDSGAPPRAAASSAPARAVDSGELDRIQAMDRSGQWGKAVDRYGVQFLVRIHFRKYEFEKVRWLLRTGKIAKEADVRFVRDTIRLMEGRLSSDPRLGRHLKDMTEVRRIAQMKLNSIHQVKKNL